MRKLQSVAAAAALAAASLGVATAANAATAAPGNRAQAATASWGGAGGVRANERVVEAFLQDVINEHHGDHAASYLNPGMQWSGGTVGRRCRRRLGAVRGGCRRRARGGAGDSQARGEGRGHGNALQLPHDKLLNAWFRNLDLIGQVDVNPL